MTQVPPVAVAPVPTSVSSYWSPLGVVVIAMGRERTTWIVGCLPS